MEWCNQNNREDGWENESMKSILMRAGIITCLILPIWSFNEVQAVSSWPYKCSAFGEVKSN